MAADGRVVLVVGDGAAAERVAARLEATGQRVLRSPWARSEFLEIEKRPASAADCDVLIAWPAEGDVARWPALLERVRAGGAVVLAGAQPPRDVAALADVVHARGLAFLDAPVSAAGAIPVGGTEAELEGVRPLLEAVGTPVLQGAPGTGQQARLCSEIVLGSALLGLCEAFAYARAAGLDAERVLQVLPGVGEAGGAALAERVRRMLRGEASDAETVAQLVNDADAVLADAESIDLDLPGLELTRLVYAEIADMGLGQSGAEALAALWRDDEDGPDLVQLGRR